MSVNQLLPFATGTGANVLGFTAYSALSSRGTGFVAGTAQSQQLNTVWRQSAFVSSMIGQFIVDKAAVDVLDDGDVAGLEAKFVAALTALINALIAAGGGGGGGGTGAYLPLAGGTMNTDANINLVGAGRVKINGSNVWYPGNQGAGSGMDSDLLDGLQSTQFARRDTDSEYLAGGYVNFSKALVSAGVYRAMVDIVGQTGQNGGGYLRFLNGAGNQVSATVILNNDRRNLQWSMWSDAGATFQQQMILYDTGDLYLRKLANYGLAGGMVADAIAYLNGRINAIPTGGGPDGNTGPLDGVSIGAYQLYDAGAYSGAPPPYGGSWVIRGSYTYSIVTGYGGDSYTSPGYLYLYQRVA